MNDDAWYELPFVNWPWQLQCLARTGGSNVYPSIRCDLRRNHSGSTHTADRGMERPTWSEPELHEWGAPDGPR